MKTKLLWSPCFLFEWCIPCTEQISIWKENGVRNKEATGLGLSLRHCFCGGDGDDGGCTGCARISHAFRIAMCFCNIVKVLLGIYLAIKCGVIEFYKANSWYELCMLDFLFHSGFFVVLFLTLLIWFSLYISARHVLLIRSTTNKRVYQ